MIGQVGLGESGRIVYCPPVQPIVSQTRSVAGNQALGEASSLCQITARIICNTITAISGVISTGPIRGITLRKGNKKGSVI